MLTYKAVVIGSGISGMTASIYLKRAGINPLIIESGAPGGQLNRSSIIENYPGFKQIDGPSLAFNIYNQVNDLKIDYLFSKVDKIDLKNKIINTSKEEVKFDYLIIATGRSPKKLGLEHEEILVGRGISYCALCDGSLYKNKNVLIVGGGNSALEEALYLSNICRKVTLINYKNEFKAEFSLVEAVLSNKKVEVIYNNSITKYNIEDNKLVSVTLSNDKIIAVDGIFIDIGYLPNSDIFELEKNNGYIIVDSNYMTSVNNVYACGDIIQKNTYQLTTAVGEATNVANNIINKIKKEEENEE